jgi:hypothetical protein
MLGVGVRKMKALTCKSRQTVTRFVYSLYAINSKLFLLADFHFCRVFLGLDKYILPFGPG